MYKTTGNTAIGKSRRKFETMERIRANAVGITAFNGGDEPAILIHDAMTYVFPPSGLWLGPDDVEPREYDGTCVLRDVYGTNPESIRAARPAAKQAHSAAPYKAIPKDRLISRAIDIASRAESKLRNRGIVILTGDPAQDERMKRDAKESWVQYRVNRALAANEAYKKRTASFFASPHRVATENPPVKSAFENAEQAWLDEYNDGVIGGRKFVCKYKCGFQHDDKAIMARHLRVAHRAARDEERVNASLDGDAPPPTKVVKRRRRPLHAPEEQPAA